MEGKIGFIPVPRPNSSSNHDRQLIYTIIERVTILFPQPARDLGPRKPSRLAHPYRDPSRERPLRRRVPSCRGLETAYRANAAISGVPRLKHASTAANSS
jgi:hypothetical protein